LSGEQRKVIQTIREKIVRWALRGVALPAPEQSKGGFVTLLNQSNLDVTPIKTKTEELDAYVGWVYACVAKISSDLRTNPRGIFIKQGKRREDWKPMKAEKIPSIFKRPNLRQTWGQLVEVRNIYKDLTGEAYWHLITSSPGGKISGIEMIQSDWVEEPIYNAERTQIAAWKVNIPGRGGSRDIDARDVVPDFYPNPKDQTRGASPVEAFALAHYLDIYMRAYGLKMIRDGAMIGQYLTSEHIESDDDADAAEARMMKKYRTPGRIPVFGKGAKLETAGLPLRDLDMLRMIKPSMDMILAIYGVPRAKFGLTEGLGQTNQEVSDKSYQENCLLPRLLTFDEIMNEIIFPRVFGDQADGLAYESESPVEADRAFLLKKASAKFEAGASTVNMFHQEIGDDGIGPDGDVFFVPNDVTVTKTLEDLIGLNDVEPVTPGAPGAPAAPAAGDPAAGDPNEQADPAASTDPAAEPAGDAKKGAPRVRMFRLDDVAEKITARIQKAAEDGKAKSADEIQKLRKKNAELRFLSTQDDLERTCKSKCRSLFTKEYKIVRDAMVANVRGLTKRKFRDDMGSTIPEGSTLSFAENVATRDWLDEALNRTSEDWRTLLQETIGSGVRTGWGLLQEEVAGALSFSIFERRAAEYAARQAGVHVVDIRMTTDGALRDLIRRGIENGDSIDEMAKSLSQLYDGWKGTRSNTIARTETASSIGYGKHANARETAHRLNMDIRRSWSSVNDDRTRDDHRDADADVNERNRDIGVDDHYSVGGYDMSHPGDSSAPAKEVINCRCTETYRDAGA
jgi:phage portal protein BeeE